MVLAILMDIIINASITLTDYSITKNSINNNNYNKDQLLSIYKMFLLNFNNNNKLTISLNRLKQT